MIGFVVDSTIAAKWCWSASSGAISGAVPMDMAKSRLGRASVRRVVIRMLSRSVLRRSPVSGSTTHVVSEPVPK
jgi:hypothetical protein